MTIREIAKQAGVSPATVSLVLNNKPGVGAQRRQQIQTILLENGYQIKENKPLQAKRKQICIAKYRVSYQTDTFSTSLMDTIEMYANLAGYSVNLLNIDSNTYQQKLSTLDFSNVCGIIFFASDITESCLNDTMQLPIPAVYVDIFSSHKSINTINADQRLVAYLAAKHLHNLGHRQIGYLRCFPTRGYLSQRFSYFKTSLLEFGMQLMPSFVFDVNLYSDHLEKTLGAILEDVCTFPTAIFAESDIIAASCIQVLNSLGYRIPEDISIIGVDNTSIASFTSPPLTAVDVNTQELGRMAFERLLQLMQDPTRPVMHCYIEPFLKRRGSTGFVRQSYPEKPKV